MNNEKVERVNLKKYIKTNITITLVFFFIIDFVMEKLVQKSIINSTSIDLIGPFSINSWTISLLLSQFFFYIYQTRLWKMWGIHYLFNRNIPVIDGRWEGKLKREGKDHNFVLEINQTLQTVSCVSFTKNSRSRSIVSELKINVDSTYLDFSWKGHTKNDGDELGESNMFIGYTRLELMNKDRVLEGYYFTNRKRFGCKERGTSGSLELYKKKNKKKIRAFR